MRTWERYVRDQDGIAMAERLIAVLADLYGCDHAEDAIKRAVYKNTECGAWITFFDEDKLGVTVGSIVEGSNAEVPGIFVAYDSEDDDGFIRAYRQAIEDVERGVDEIIAAEDTEGAPPYDAATATGMYDRDC